MLKKDYTTLHINLPNEHRELFSRMKAKTASRSNTAVLLAALRALELQEALRDKDIATK